MYAIAVNKSQEFLLNVRRLFHIFFRRRRKAFDFDNESVFFRRRTLVQCDSTSRAIVIRC